MNKDFLLEDQESVADLQSFLQRAKRLDPDGSVRLRAFGQVLAAYVSPLYSGNLMDSGPTVVGLRTCALAEPAEIDSVVGINAVLERLARINNPDMLGNVALGVAVPPTERAPWAGILPPMSGWAPAGTVAEALLTQTAKEGIDEVASTIPESVGGPIAARIRAEIWGKAIAFDSKIPKGAAFAAAGLGFLTQGEEVEVYLTDGWVRLSALHGHVLAKVAVRH